MANIQEIISEVRKLNPDLARQIEKFVKDHSYGLVFERNLPEAVRLYTKKPAVGDTVNILPERGCTEKEEHKVAWYVKDIQNGIATIVRDNESKNIPVEDIVTLVSYKDTIYPGLKEIDRIERGNPDDPYHVVINSENYHALEALTYAYAGKVDCIYIDPPYNKEDSKDWKYNCNYVDGNDQYRHSKWLAFIERRLKLAKRLLNPKDSVLIVTIDETEYNRLGLLLEQIFPDAKIQMVSSVINHASVARTNEFNRNNEFLYFVMIGDYSIASLEDSKNFGAGDKINWETLRRHNAKNLRSTAPMQFYPIFVNKATGFIEEIGDPIGNSTNIKNGPQREGCIAVYPIRDNGTEMIWGCRSEELRKRFKSGYVKAASFFPKKPQQYSIQYLTSGTIEDIENGKILVKGYAPDGSVIGCYNEPRSVMPKTQWDIATHDARDYGTKILKNIFSVSPFPFAKSLYAVHDTLEYFVSNKRNALIIDFFAGSGTTLHAVNLLNTEDGGHRICICVTNNAISSSEEDSYIKAGLRPSDPDWEKYGIANYVTWPRVKCYIKGVDIDGNPLQGHYGCETEVYQEYEGDVVDSETGKKVRGTLYKIVKQPAYSELAKINMSDGFKANAIFFELTYESAWNIRLDQAFNAVAPILWLLAGCKGEILRKIGKSYLTTDYYGVLFDYSQASKFCQKIKATPTIKTVFVVTDDQRRYSNMCKRLPGIEVHRLYESFLKTFEICGEGGLD